MTLPRGIWGFALYTILLGVAAYFIPLDIIRSNTSGLLFVIGWLALWRYSWGLTHYLRHLWYRRITFPRLRATVDTATHNLWPSQIYLLITSYKIDANTTTAVYKAALREAANCGIATTLIASIVDEEDERLITTLARDFPAVPLVILRLSGTGKRDALAQGFMAISRAMPNDDAVVAVIDGDSILEEGLIRKCVPFFKTMPNLGALTTDEICEVEGSPAIRAWHDMRFAQRQILMSSVALSNKVLTLTGRMSMFRASIVTTHAFIDGIRNDLVDHWRLGRFRMLTGDDKSSWFHLLKDGWDMLYIPDTIVTTIEHPPHPNFFRASTMLMFRWFGNMLRTNDRALALGPRRVGFFTWWCILDQRLSMWTSLSSPAFVVMLAIAHHYIIILAYFVWIGITRWVMTLMLVSTRPVLSAWYPFMLYYNQVWGSLIKTYVFFRLDRQTWTRQKTKLQRDISPLHHRINAIGSAVTHVIALSVFISIIGLISGTMRLPDIFWQIIQPH